MYFSKRQSWWSSDNTIAHNSDHRPVETVHHLQVAPQVLFGQVVQHAGVHQTLHKVGTVLRQTKTGQPLVPNPFMVHVSICQSLQRTQQHRAWVLHWKQYNPTHLIPGGLKCTWKSNRKSETITEKPDIHYTISQSNTVRPVTAPVPSCPPHSPEWQHDQDKIKV